MEYKSKTPRALIVFVQRRIFSFFIVYEQELDKVCLEEAHPQAAKQLVRWLSEDEAREHMRGRPFVVFGLGNSKYSKFAGGSVTLDQLAEDAGGKRMLELYKARVR